MMRSAVCGHAAAPIEAKDSPRVGRLARDDGRRALRRGAARLLVALVLVSGLGVPAGANAAWPGGNGRVAYFEDDSGGLTPYGLRVDGNPFVVGPFCQEGTPRACGDRPAWSSDGTWLAHDRSDGLLGVSRPDGGQLRTLGFAGIFALRPAFSPNGAQLVFEGRVAGRSNLYVVNRNGANLRRLTGRGGGQPSWSSTDRIAFRRSGNLFTMRPDGSALRRVTFLGAAAPDWSPHATQIAFIRNGKLHRVRPSGRGLVRLTGRNAFEPAWRPDGQRILFHRILPGGIQRIIFSVRTSGEVLRTERTGNEGRAGHRVRSPSVEPLR